MKIFFRLLLISVFLLNFQAKADEGMWILSLLNKNYAQMKKQGFKLTPEDIYSLNKASIKDAIAIFGGSCTSVIVSDKGLLLTNHHCGYRAIQSQSSVEHNYLKDGFWAMNFKEELPIPGLSVQFFVRIEDVTVQINKKIKSKMTEVIRQEGVQTFSKGDLTTNITKKTNRKISEEERGEIIRKISNKIIRKATRGNNYMARVQSFFNGNNYYLVVYKIYSDVRLVGSPPESIGKFGYQTDNWVWPRHTGDFSVFRVYMSPKGEAATYSEKNIPLKPKYFLPVSVKGIKKDDFTMVIGFPGNTGRYMTSYEIENLINVTNANRIKIRGIKQEIMMEDMKTDEKIRIQYSSKFAYSNNYWKNAIGLNKSLRKHNVYGEKQKIENKFIKWYNQDNKRKAKYGNVLTLIKNANMGMEQYQSVDLHITEALFKGIEIFNFINNIESKLDKPEEIKELAKGFFKDYSKSTDKKIALAMLNLFNEDINMKYHPSFLRKEINKKLKGNFNTYIDNLYAKSIFTNEAAFFRFMENYNKKKIQQDPAFIAVKSINKTYDEFRAKSKKFATDLAKGKRIFIAGLMEMDKDRNFYPDANFTIRLSHGKVGGYRPRDGIIYDYFTTLEGVMEKKIPGNFEFNVSPKLKELYQKKDYGKYGQDGKMPVCFTSNDDITGGNSGSPVMNGNGELIGLAFDGNWEAISGDIAFEHKLQKCINVDIRYVLFIIDKLGGAKYLVDEMKIVE